MNPPVIIIGMHRSGTSLVARLLDVLGLFLGKYKDENHEARLFISINDWFLRVVQAELGTTRRQLIAY